MIFMKCLILLYLAKSEFISSCSRPAVGSNIVQITRATFFVNVFFLKWPPVAILDIQKSPCLTFLTISDQYHNFYFVKFFYKLAGGGQLYLFF